MADTPRTNPPAEDDMHWGISYLREDIQDLRLDQRAGLERMERISTRIEVVNDNLTARIGEVGESLTARMDSMGQGLTVRMDAKYKELTDRMDAKHKELTVRMDDGNNALSDRIDSRFAVLLTTMIALIGISIGANFTFLQMYLPPQ